VRVLAGSCTRTGRLFFLLPNLSRLAIESRTRVLLRVKRRRAVSATAAARIDDDDDGPPNNDQDNDVPYRIRFVLPRNGAKSLLLLLLGRIVLESEEEREVALRVRVTTVRIISVRLRN
jgi:hypothetical protein